MAMGFAADPANFERPTGDSRGLSLPGALSNGTSRLDRERMGGESEKNRKAKYYRLTAAGKRRLNEETEKWNRMANGVAGILRTRPEEI